MSFFLKDYSNFPTLILFLPSTFLFKGIVGAIAGLFSSCDESYEVIPMKTVQRWPCKNFTMQVVTTMVPKTTCNLENIMVNGGFSDPEECNCRKELCSVKTTDLSCIQKNRECQKERKERLDGIGKGSRLHTLFKQLLDGIDDLENDVEELFSEVERTRKEKDFAVDALNRTINSLRVVEQESKLAKQSENNQQSIMRKEICIQEKYKLNSGLLNFEIEKISFNSKLPIVCLLYTSPSPRDS